MSISVAVPMPETIRVFSSSPSSYFNPFVEISSLQFKHIPFLFLCPSAGSSSCTESISPQREQCVFAVLPAVVQVASTAAESITSSCPSAGNVSFSLSPHLLHERVFSPSVSQVASCAIVHSLHSCLHSHAESAKSDVNAITHNAVIRAIFADFFMSYSPFPKR